MNAGFIYTYPRSTNLHSCAIRANDSSRHTTRATAYCDTGLDITRGHSLNVLSTGRTIAVFGKHRDVSRILMEVQNKSLLTSNFKIRNRSSKLRQLKGSSSLGQHAGWRGYAQIGYLTPNYRLQRAASQDDSFHADTHMLLAAPIDRQKHPVTAGASACATREVASIRLKSRPDVGQVRMFWPSSYLTLCGLAA